MKLQYLLLILFIAILTSCSTTSVRDEEALFDTENPIEVTEMNISLIEDDVLERVNAHRTETGLTALEFSSQAYKYAEEHNNYMIAKGKISHDNFHERVSQLANETGATVVKENVAKNYPSAKHVLNRWLNSQFHKNTIQGDFTHTTISVKADEKGKLYFTQLFFKK